MQVNRAEPVVGWSPSLTIWVEPLLPLAAKPEQLLAPCDQVSVCDVHAAGGGGGADDVQVPVVNAKLPLLQTKVPLPTLGPTTSLMVVEEPLAVLFEVPWQLIPFTIQLSAMPALQDGEGKLGGGEAMQVGFPVASKLPVTQRKVALPVLGAWVSLTERV